MNQIEQAMQEAGERLAANGYENADLRDIVLVGFGYLASKMGGRGIVINSRVAFPLGAAATGVAAGVLRILGLV